MSIKIEAKVTEKALNLVDNENIYTFAIRGNLSQVTKTNVSKWVGDKYDVTVESVKLLNRLGKKKRAGNMRQYRYRQPDVKIAYVKLAEDDKISEFTDVLEQS